MSEERTPYQSGKPFDPFGDPEEPKTPQELAAIAHGKAAWDGAISDAEHAAIKSDWVAFREDWLAFGFIAVPAVIWRSPALTLGARAVYVELLSYCWQGRKTWTSLAKMGEHLRVTEKTLRRYLKELETIGLITKERRGLGLPSLHWLEPLSDALVARLADRENFPSRPGEFPG